MRVLHLVLLLPVYDEAVSLDEDIVLQRLLHTQQVAVDGLGLEDRKYFVEIKLKYFSPPSGRQSVSQCSPLSAQPNIMRNYKTHSKDKIYVVCRGGRKNMSFIGMFTLSTLQPIESDYN